MTKRKSENITSSKKIIKKEIIYINHNIKTIDDLICVGNQYIVGNIYNINLEKLHKLIPVLTKLNKVVGMETVKQNIINHIIYFIQDFQDKNSDMLHIVIQGPPGVGKTMLGEIIAEIYFTLDIIEQNFTNNTSSDSDNESNIYGPAIINNKFKFIIAKRSDLIGKYLGHTAIKTQEMINKSLGGVLFIDEAYSLGNAEGRDSFSKECIDTINQNLTEKKNQLLVIIAGYQGALDTCFFNYNEGLRRRFPFIYTIEKYTPLEMSQILQRMIINLGRDWEIITEQQILEEFFKKNILLFPNSAGDIETLIFLIKIEHSKRLFCNENELNQRKKINNIDLENALKTFILNKEIKEQTKFESQLMMYI